MKKRYASKSKSKGKDKIKVKTSQNTDKREQKNQIQTIKPVPVNQLQNTNDIVQINPPKEIKDEKTKKQKNYL